MDGKPTPKGVEATSQQLPTEGVWVAAILAKANNEQAEKPCIVASTHPADDSKPMALIATFERTADMIRTIAALQNAQGLSTEEVVAAKTTAQLQAENAFMSYLLDRAKDAAQDDATWAAMREGILASSKPPVTH